MKKRWNNIPIKKKLMVFWMSLIIGMSVFSVYLIMTTYGYIDNFKNATNEYFKINMLHQYNSDNNSLLSNYLDDAQMDNLAAFNESVDAFNSNLKDIEDNSQSLEAYLLIRSINNSFTYYLQECNTAITKRMDGNGDYLTHFYNSYRINQYLEDYIGQLLETGLHEGSTVYRRMAADATMMKYITVGFILAFLLVYVVSSFTVSNRLTKPIKHLADLSIQMSEGNLDIEEIQVESNDEVGILTRSFNKMSSSIKTMINDLKEKAKIEKKLIKEELINIKNKELLREARFQALQSQINPHFLFNTLNTISQEITLSRKEGAVELINSMSNLLRYNMGNSDMYVSLKDELEIMKKYFFIEQYRYKERLEVDIRCDASLDADAIMIPCFTLQPVVENAIIHGIEPKVEGGKVRVKVYRDKNKAIIKIIDNGIGIEKDRIKSIMALKEKEKSGHTSAIGISNVMNRLIISCGSKNCFTIKSKVGLGTIAIMKIPLKKKMSTNV